MEKLVLQYNNSKFKVCINKAENGLISGFVVGIRLAKPLPFSDINSLILGLEGVMDGQNYPQSFNQSRTFKPQKPDLSYVPLNKSECMEGKVVDEAKGGVHTFEIRVTTRLNSTWQGEMMKDDKSVKFASVLELMHMISELI